MKKVLSIVLVVACLLSIVGSFGGCLSSETDNTDTAGDLQQFASRRDLVNAIESVRNEQRFDRWRYGMLKGVDEATAIPETSAANDYSTTNVQTEGVDEGDLVKTDGSYIYRLTGNGFSIVAANDGTITPVCSIPIANYVPQEMYVTGDRLVLIGGLYDKAEHPYGAMAYNCYWRYWGYQRTNVRVYNISDRANPVALREITTDGYFETSRLVDGKLTYVSSYNVAYEKKGKYMPHVSDTYTGAVDQELELDHIFHYGNIQSMYYKIVGRIDVLDTTSQDICAYLGLLGELYMTAENMYFAENGYENYFDEEQQRKANEYHSTQYVRLTKIDCATLRQTARVRLDGYIKDRYSLDEYDGYLRIATTVYMYRYTGESYGGERKSFSRVYVLDGNLQQVGLIDNIAPGESIYSVRMKGMTGSLVTFQQIDPYFNLDFTDPANPQISKGLKEEGVSYYIHYLGDSGLTIGAGVDTYLDDYGNARSAGIKVSLYDNTSGEAVNLVTHTLGDNGYAELFYNPKALLYDERVGLFAFAVDYYDDHSNQGLLVFFFDTEAKTLSEPVLLTNHSTDMVESYDAEYYDSYYDNCIQRGLRIGDYIYTISYGGITSYTLDGLEPVSRYVDEA